MTSKRIFLLISCTLALLVVATYAFAQFTDPYTPEDIPRNLPLYMFIGAVLALPVSLVLLWLYRRKVIARMRAFGKDKVRDQTSPDIPVGTDLRLSTEFGFKAFDYTSRIAATSAAERLHAKATLVSWGCAAIYMAGGAFFAFTKAALDIVSSYTPSDLLIQGFPQNPVSAWLLFSLVYMWPVIFSTVLIAAWTWASRLALIFAYLLTSASLWLFITIPFDTLFIFSLKWHAPDFLQTLLVHAAPGVILLIIFLNRRVRAIGVLVLLFISVMFTGISVAYAAIEGLKSRGVMPQQFVEVGAIISSLAAFGFAGWMTLKWVRHRYERKKLNDQSLIMDAIWLFLGVGDFFLVIYGTPPRIISGLLAFLIYKLTVLVGMSLLNRRRGAVRDAPTLLVLRVFSLGKRSARLFDALTLHWRYIGPVQLIVGPDLATTTIEPHDLLDFLAGKLSRRFIDSSQSLELRLSETDMEPDRDGRFRVNEFFCNDETWQMVLSQLVGNSDVVFMDLRGFSAKNSGCLLELKELIEVVPLEHVVISIDETTNEQFLRDTAQRFWSQMRPSSPQYETEMTPLIVYNLTGPSRQDISQLTRILCAAAQSASN